jgi:hypothetical protein
MGLHPQRADREQTLAFEPMVCHPGLCGQGSRKMPVSLATQGGENGLTFARTEREQVANHGAHTAPLFPVTHANAPSQPTIKLRHGSEVIRDTKATHPASNVLRKFPKQITHRYAPTAIRQLTDAMQEGVKAVAGPAQLRPSERKPEAL